MRVGSSRSMISLCLCACVVSTSTAAAPRDEILRLIPEDAGLCILVQDLRGSAERLQQSPFAQALAASPIGQAWRDAPETRQLAAIDQQLRTHLNISATQLRDDILGDAFALVVVPGPPGKPEQDQGLLLVHARNPERLAALLDRLNDVQQESGELVSRESRVWADKKYVVRKKKDGEEFYWREGPLFAFSDSEDRIRAVLAGDRRNPPADDAAPTQLQNLRALGVEQDLCVIWVNPRRFDAAIQAKLATAPAAEAAALKNFEAIWIALDGAALSFRLARDAAIRLSLQGQSAKLPPALRDALIEMRQPAKLAAAFPDDALMVAAGRWPWPPAVESPAAKPWRDLVDGGVGAMIGRTLFGEAFRHVGPEFGVCVAPPRPDGPGWLPTVTAALQWAAPVDPSFLAKLDAFLQLIVAGVNAQHAAHWQLRTESQDQVGIRTLENASLLTAGFQPSIAWKNGYLVVASSPDAIRRFQPAGQVTVESKETDVPLLRLNVAGWAKYLRAQRGRIAQFAAQSNNLPLNDVQQRIDRLLDTLDLLDAVDMSQRTDSDRATITLRLRTTKPMLADDKKPH